MGLEMAVKKSLTRENAVRYAKASKKEKTKIIDEHCATTGYNRKYAIAEFNRLVQIKHGSFNGRQTVSVKLKEKKPQKKASKNESEFIQSNTART